MDFAEWEDTVVRDCGLTVGDIRALQPGDQLHVIRFDRNVLDTLSNIHGATPRSRPKTMPLCDFFDNSYDVYTHVEGLRGKMKWSFEDESQTGDFDFHVLHGKYGLWLPFTLSPKSYLKNPIYAERWDRDIEDFEDDVSVGWRGPMILYEHVLQQPPITFWDTHDFGLRVQHDWHPVNRSRPAPNLI